MIKFLKYQGAGNDFIMIDNRDQSFSHNKVAFAQKWCERRFGIGSDGIIFLERDNDVDFLMDFYNPDGSQSFCGNGSRCIMQFAQDIGFIKDAATFKAIDGIHEAHFTELGVKVKMGDVDAVEHIDDDLFIHTGSPHYISYRSEDDDRNIVDFGRKIRYSEKYKQDGTNVNLVDRLAPNHIRVETYERGVENETFACGTGATACGLSYGLLENLASGPVVTEVKGGTLKIHFDRNEESFTNVWLEGPAQFVFEGIINE